MSHAFNYYGGERGFDRESIRQTLRDNPDATKYMKQGLWRDIPSLDAYDVPEDFGKLSKEAQLIIVDALLDGDTKILNAAMEYQNGNFVSVQLPAAQTADIPVTGHAISTAQPTFRAQNSSGAGALMLIAAAWLFMR